MCGARSIALASTGNVYLIRNRPKLTRPFPQHVPIWSVRLSRPTRLHTGTVSIPFQEVIDLIPARCRKINASHFCVVQISKAA